MLFWSEMLNFSSTKLSKGSLYPAGTHMILKKGTSENLKSPSKFNELKLVLYTNKNSSKKTPACLSIVYFFRIYFSRMLLSKHKGKIHQDPDTQQEQTISVHDKGGHTFSVKSQIVNTSGFASHAVSIATLNSAIIAQKQPETILKLHLKNKRQPGFGPQAIVC